jgi:hypothetical protein
MNASLINAGVTLVPGDRFFLKEVTLDPAAGAAAQVELALEESSPFPLAQLYYGFVTGPDRKIALAFAAYRRRFANEELADWPASAVVLPEFLALIGPPPAEPQVVLQVHPAGIYGVAWDGRASLPVAVICKSIPDSSEAQQAELMQELRRRAGSGEIPVRRLEGPAGVGLDEAGGAVFRIAGEETARFSTAALGDADVRDKAFLDEKRRDDSRRRGWTWGLWAAAALLLLAGALELTAGALGVWNQRRRAVVASRADEVRRIETAQTLATRIEDLSARQEKPLEWLSVVSAARPRSIQFVRMVSNNDRSLTIDAQTPDAAAVGAFEAALRQRAELEQVETRDLRAREGLTSFVLAVKFKPVNGSPVTQGGQP